MIILDIDIDAFYPRYDGDMQIVDSIDKSNDKFIKDLFDKFADSLIIDKSASITVCDDHDEVYHILKEYKEHNITHIHVDAHTDRIEDRPIINDIPPTLANWVSYCISQDIINELIHYGSDEIVRVKSDNIEYVNGRAIHVINESLHFTDFSKTKEMVIDKIFISRSIEWCNYKSEDLNYIIDKLEIIKNDM